VLSIAAALPVLLGADPAPTAVLRWTLPLGAARLALDGLSAWFLLTIGIVAGCVAVYSVAYMTSTTGRTAHPVFGVLFCGLTASLILVVCAADAVVFLIGWEAMAVVAFLAVAFDHERAEVRSGAWLYLIAMHIGTALCVLPLFGLLTALVGTTEFSQFSSAAQSWSPRTLVILFVLGVLGFGTKAGFMPMHVWLPAAHPVAPTPVSALLSGVVVKMGIYGLLRLLSWLPPLPAGCAYLLLIIAVVSGVMGVLYALAQHDLKRLLAYHTVENIGIIALGISVGMLGQATGHVAVAVLGYAGALLHVANHALFKGLLFLSAGAVLRSTGTTDIERLGGLAKTTPVNAGLFLVGAVAICGLPPLNGFVSEWVVYGALFGGAIHGEGTSAVAPALGLVALALMGGLALACFAKVFGVVFLGEPRDPRVHAECTPALMRIGMGGLALACVVIGLAPGLWLPLVYRAADALTGAVPATAVAPAMRNVLAPAETLSLLAMTLLAWLVGLALLRRWMLARTAARYPTSAPNVGTWGCGYTQPTPRMQYSASSFVASLVGSFRHLLWPQRTLRAPEGAFPRGGHLESSAPDLALQDLLVPMFRGIARLFAIVRTVSWSGVAATPASPTITVRSGPIRVLLTGVVGALRRGSIQMHLAFIVLTLLAVFVIETASSPAAGGPPEPGDSGAAALRIEP
jgi:hydrogenase-4 component B